jgi:hypothetical protein
LGGGDGVPLAGGEEEGGVGGVEGGVEAVQELITSGASEG